MRKKCKAGVGQVCRQQIAHTYTLYRKRMTRCLSHNLHARHLHLKLPGTPPAGGQPSAKLAGELRRKAATIARLVLADGRIGLENAEDYAALGPHGTRPRSVQICIAARRKQGP